MASHKELSVEWTMLDGDYNNWTVEGKPCLSTVNFFSHLHIRISHSIAYVT